MSGSLKLTMLLPAARRYGAHTRERLPWWAGHAALSICTFVIGVQLVFPYARVVERVSAAVAAEHVVRIDRLERGWLPGRFTLHGVHVATRAPEPFELTFDRIEVDLELGALLAGRIESRVDARGDSGRLRGRVGEGRAGGVELDLVATELPLARLAGTPIDGDPELRLRLSLASSVLSAARGEIQVACQDCTIGSHPRVQLGPIAGRAVVSDGVVCLAPLRARSGDGAFLLEGGVRLSDDIAGTRADLLAAFEPSAAFRAASPAHRDLAAGFGDRAARGPLAELRWAAEPEPADRCARLRRPEAAPIAAPVALAPRSPRMAAAPPEPEPEPPPREPAPAALEPEVPLFAPPPAAHAEEPSPELPLEY